MTLISQEDDGTSTVTATQAKEFLQDEVVDMVRMLLLFSIKITP